ncbi:MAG: helix-turn-helix domain-containing protein [Hyphomicrobiaceae bacterium]
MIENWSAMLKSYRRRYGLSQRLLAKMLGVSQRTVSRWERDEDRPNKPTQRRMRDLGLEPPAEVFSNLTASIMHCPAPRALSRKQSLRLLCLSRPAIAKRPSIVNYVGHDLLPLASGVLQEILDDHDLQRDILNREVACVMSTTRSVLRTNESAGIRTYHTTISYFSYEGTLYSDAISVPAPSGAVCGHRPVPVGEFIFEWEA